MQDSHHFQNYYFLIQLLRFANVVYNYLLFQKKNPYNHIVSTNHNMLAIHQPDNSHD